MLTDIFADRYKNRPIWDRWTPENDKLVNQAYRIVTEQLFPFKKDDEKSETTWKMMHDRLATEMGVQELAESKYTYEWNDQTFHGTHTHEALCRAHVLATHNLVPAGVIDYFVDRSMKLRLSFIEIAFRQKELEVAIENRDLPATLFAARQVDARRHANPPTTWHADRAKSANDYINSHLKSAVHELNERFKQVGLPLTYHNGFIQITKDELAETKIAKPFWELLRDPKWVNVDMDMKEALDRLEAADRDPAFYAAKALESTIKIICGDKGWTTGNEKGASDYLNHLEKKTNGPFIDPWERGLIQRFLTGVRNELGHEPGGEPMPVLSNQQAAVAIEMCMSWIKGLITRRDNGPGNFELRRIRSRRVQRAC